MCCHQGTGLSPLRQRSLIDTLWVCCSIVVSCFVSLTCVCCKGDRIGDGISVRVNRVLVVVRLKGLLKDAPVGTWTPPCTVVELFGVSINSTDEHCREFLDLAALWKAVNYKQPEVMVYKQLKIERMVVKLIPTWPKLFKVDIKQRGPLPAVVGEAVLLDQSPCLLKVNITIRKRFRDSAMLGLMINIEAERLVVDLLNSGGDNMMAHVLVSFLQCVSRQGEIAWADKKFRARLWEAVDKGELPLAKVYGAQGKKKGEGKMSFFTVVDTESSTMAVLKEEELEDDDDMEFIDDSTHSETSRLKDKDKDANLAPPPRIAVGVDIDHLSILVGSTGLDGGLRIEVLGIQIDQLGNVKLPMECLNSSATIIEAARHDQEEDKPFMDVMQVRVSDVRVVSLHPATGDTAVTLLYTQRDLSKPETGGGTPLRFLRRGVERGFDPRVDVAVSRGRRGDFNPLLPTKKVFGHAIGMMILAPKNSKAIPFPKVTSKIHVDIPATLSLVMDPKVALLPDYLSHVMDSRWFTGVGWPMEGGRGAVILTSRVEPMQQPAPACMVVRLRGGVKLVLPSPEDIPTLPSLTMLIKSVSAIKDHTNPRYCLETLEKDATDDEFSAPSLLPDRWTLSCEEVQVLLSSLDSSATTSPDTQNVDILSINRMATVISLDLHTTRRARASSFKRQHSIDCMLAVQRSSFNRVNPDAEDEMLLPSPGLDMSYVTRAVEGTSYNISLDVDTIVASGDVLSLVAGSQLVLYCVKSVVLTSDSVTQMLTEDSATTANSMARLSEVTMVGFEEMAESPLAAFTLRVRVKAFLLNVPSPFSSLQAALAVSVGVLQVQLGMKQSEKAADELEIETLAVLVNDMMLSTPEQDDNALMALKSAQGFTQVDWLNNHARAEIDGDGLACIADSKKLVAILCSLARRWGTARVSVVVCDRTNCLYGDEVSLLEFVNSPMVYLDLLGDKALVEEDEVEVVVSPVEASGTLAALLPAIGMDISARLRAVEVQLPPSAGSDRWTVVRLSEVQGALGLDSPSLDRAMALSGATTLAVAHGAPEETDDEWTKFNSATDCRDDDAQLISPLRVDADLHIADTAVTMTNILDGVALKCNMRPVLDQAPMGDYSVEVEKGSEDRLSVALRDPTSLRGSVRGAEEGPKVVSSPTSPVQRKSVPLRRVSMAPSSTLSLRLAVGTVTRLQALLDEQMIALEQLLAVLVAHGWLSPETITTTTSAAMDSGGGAVVPVSVSMGRDSQVADDLVALGKTMQEARAAADALGEEVKSRTLKNKGSLRVTASDSLTSEASLGARPALLTNTSFSSSHGDSSHGSFAVDTTDSDEWALERLHSIQGLLSTAQNLQEHTKSSMSTQVGPHCLVLLFCFSHFPCFLFC